MKPNYSKSRAIDKEDLINSTVLTSSSIPRVGERGSRSSILDHGCIYNMNDCYDRLRAMVPDMPTNRRVSKVEILQHVIDYIQDLESALEMPNLQSTATEETPANNRATRVPLSTISYNRKIARWVYLFIATRASRQLALLPHVNNKGTRFTNRSDEIYFFAKEKADTCCNMWLSVRSEKESTPCIFQSG